MKLGCWFLCAALMVGCGGGGDAGKDGGDVIVDAGDGFDAPTDAARPDGDPGDRIPPTVLATSPNAGAINSVRGLVTITFSEPVEPSTLGTGAITATQAGAVAGTIEVNGAIVTFRPGGAGFRGGLEVTVTVSASVEDLAGNKLATPFVLRFTPATATLGPSQQLATIGAPTFGPRPQVTVDDAGNAWAAWHQTTTSARVDVVARRYTPAGGWATAITLDSYDGGDVTLGALVGDGAGRVIVEYIHDVPAGYGETFFRIYDPTSGTWSTATPFLDRTVTFWPVFDPYGNVFAAFTRPNAMGDDEVWRTGLPRGSLSWSNEALVRSYSEDIGISSLGASSDGHIVMINRVNYLAGAETRHDLWAYAFDPAQGWLTPQRVEQQDTALYGFGVGVGVGGNAFTTWVENNSAWRNERTAGTWGTPSSFARPVGQRWLAAFAVGAPDGGGVTLLYSEPLPPATSVGSVYASDYVVGSGWSAPVALENKPDRASITGWGTDGGGNMRVLLLQRIEAGDWYDLDMVTFDRQTRSWSQPVRVDESNSAKVDFSSAMDLAPDGSGIIIYGLDEPAPAGWTLHARAIK